MNKFFLAIQKDDPNKSKVPSEEIQESIDPFHHERHELNTTEGSEFLDDAIRMDEQAADNNWASIEELVK